MTENRQYYRILKNISLGIFIGVFSSFVFACLIKTISALLLFYTVQNTTTETFLLLIVSCVSGGYISAILPKNRKKFEIILTGILLGLILGLGVNSFISIPVIGYWKVLTVKIVIQALVMLVVYSGTLFGLKSRKNINK